MQWARTDPEWLLWCHLALALRASFPPPIGPPHDDHGHWEPPENRSPCRSFHPAARTNGTKAPLPEGTFLGHTGPSKQIKQCQISPKLLDLPLIKHQNQVDIKQYIKHINIKHMCISHPKLHHKPFAPISSCRWPWPPMDLQSLHPQRHQAYTSWANCSGDQSALSCACCCHPGTQLLWSLPPLGTWSLQRIHESSCWCWSTLLCTHARVSWLPCEEYHPRDCPRSSSRWECHSAFSSCQHPCRLTTAGKEPRNLLSACWWFAHHICAWVQGSFPWSASLGWENCPRHRHRWFGLSVRCRLIVMIHPWKRVPPPWNSHKASYWTPP